MWFQNMKSEQLVSLDKRPLLAQERVAQSQFFWYKLEFMILTLMVENAVDFASLLFKFFYL